MEIRIAQAALEELQAIKEYYREEGEDFVTAILQHCSMLQIYPDSGRVVPQFNMDHIRELIHAPFRVVYLRQAKEIVLVRVWRSERQLELTENET